MKIINPALLSAGNFFAVGSMLIFLIVLVWAGVTIASGNSAAQSS